VGAVGLRIPGAHQSDVQLHWPPSVGSEPFSATSRSFDLPAPRTTC